MSSSVFLSIVQQLAVILVFSQKGVSARPSTTPPSWTRFKLSYALAVSYKETLTM